MSVSEPGKIITPWAESGLKNTIPPAANPATGRAGFDQGFSAINMTAKEAGGIPPFGQDFNGIFYEVTNILRYMQAGGQPTFDAALATAIGGYPLGAVLIGDDGVSVFKNAVAGNETNPNTGGDGWTRPDLQVMELYRRSYAEAGYNLVDGSFEAGGTLTGLLDVLFDEASGKAFSSVGPYPMTVVKGTNPASAGFIDRSTEAIRTQLDKVLLWPEVAPQPGTIAVAAGKRVKSFVSHTSPTVGVTVAEGGEFEGGSVQNTTATSGASLDGDGAAISDVAFTGMAASTGPVTNAVSANGPTDINIDNIKAAGHTTAVALANTKRARVNGVYAASLWYQPSLFAGGYGVLLQDSSESIISGVHFTANAGDDGRHMLYVSTAGGAKCDNTIFVNSIAKYNNKSWQAHAAMNVRASRNTLIANTISDGANRGIVGTNRNGDILYGLHATNIVYAEKYDDALAAYAHSFGDGSTGGIPIGCLAASMSLRAKPRAGVSETLCFAKEIAGASELFAASITNVPPSSNPIVIRAGANNILIQGIMDFIDGGLPSAQAFILFDGPCSNISVLGCKTPRSNMFKLLSNVTDLTVDYPRTVTVVGTTGSFVKTDPNELIATITPSATQLTIDFNPHVTAAALQGIVARSTLHFVPPAIICVAGVSGKTVTLRFFDYAGTLINPAATSVSATLIINS